MVITTIPNHPAPMYVSAPVHALPAKLVKDTIYMPSQVAARLLAALPVSTEKAPEPGKR